MAQPPPQLPPGWVTQWDQNAGRQVFVETATGRTSWQPPTAGVAFPPPQQQQQQQQQQRPTHPQGQARMSMPQIQPPPGMRGPSLSPIPSHGPGAPLSPPAANPSAPASIGPGASRRRAYPTAHLTANSISYAAAPYDAGPNAAGAGYGAHDAQPQLFTPGAPDQVPSPYAAQQPAPGAPGMAPVPSLPAGAGVAPGYAAGAGVQGLTNQFQGMGMAGGMGAQKFSTLQTVNISGVQPNVNDLERPPPEIRLPPNACVSTNPKANADPSYQRCTLNAIPTTSSLLQKSKIPLGLILSPYRSVHETDGDEPVPVVTDTVIARCRRCRTYINPYVTFIENGNRWKCCMCNISNEVPQLFDWNSETNQPADRWQRPELNHSVVEFIAPREYMVRPPQPPVYTFLIDVSYQAVNSGMVATAARTILETLDRLPNSDNRAKICIIGVDTSLHFFSITPESTEPEMLVVSDLDDVFLPKPNDLLVNLTECRAGVEALLQRLGDMYKDSLVTGSALGAALQAAYKLISPIGGKIMVLTASLPSVGPGALKNREDPKLLGTAKESTLLGAASSFYKTFPIDCSRSQVSVDMFLFAPSYTDVATLSCLPRYTGGQTFFYPAFHAGRSEDAVKFSHEFSEVLSSPISYEAVLRLRATKGIRATAFHGNFFVRSTDLLALPAVPLDQNYAIECEIEETINAPFVVFQSVVLHSTSSGERRIRVVNLALPTTSSMSEVYANADQVAIATLLADKAVERSIHSRLEDARDALFNKLVDIFSTYKSTMTSSGTGASPQLSIAQNMAQLPLLVLALLKHVGIRQSSSIPSDLRAYAQALLTTLPAQQLVPYLHANFYCLHNMSPEAGTIPADKSAVVMPVKLNLTSERFERHGLYLIEDGQNMFLWIGREAVPQLCLDVFDAANYNALRGGKTTLPKLENSMNQRVNAIVQRIRESRRGVYRPHLYVVKEDGEPSLRLWALSLLVEDRFEQTPSYMQFIGQLRDKVNGGS
ncbi:Protein transport protein SEC24 [Melanopsichium pennsylvanicum]|uniref:Protein transport protein SEC24 n=2 Tax=Melanopsichium pennsylvanicum TaxID=63383 RepID=A0AAJ4XLJ0_9BASI|nr:probable SEC24-COPII coated vesicle component [Melanopsichium pennsylvanicum 4]SNX85029.1 Protein transport protein SEC24 [Melanopsichium pennsylvanicum]